MHSNHYLGASMISDVSARLSFLDSQLTLASHLNATLTSSYPHHSLFGALAGSLIVVVGLGLSWATNVMTLGTIFIFGVV